MMPSTAPGATTVIPPQATLGTSTLLLMAVATGLCAGSNYFNQPLLHPISTGLFSVAAQTLVPSSPSNPHPG